MAHSKGINLPLNVLFQGLTSQSKGNIEEVSQQFAKVLKPFAKPLGINIDTKSINNLKDLEELLTRLGASVQRTGKNFTVMMQNASGVEGIGSILASEVKSGANKGKTYFRRQDATYLANRLKPTEQLNQDYKNLITATKELNRLEEKGLKNTDAWDKQVEAVKRYDRALQTTIEHYTAQFNLKTKSEARLGGKTVWDGEGALAKIQSKQEFELQRIRTTHQSAMNKQTQTALDASNTKKANQALQDYLTTSNKLILAKEKLVKMETKGYYNTEVSQEEIDIQKAYIADLENQANGYLQSAQGAENYARVTNQVQNANNTLANTTTKLIRQEAKRNIERRQAQAQAEADKQAVSQYVSTLQTQYREEEKLVRLQQAKAPEAVIQAQRKVVDETKRQTDALYQRVQGTEELTKVQDKLTLAEKQHKQRLVELTNTTQKSVSIFGKFKETLKQVVSAGLSWKIFSAITQTVKKTIDTVTELDKSLVNLQIATGDTRIQAEELLKTYNSMAKELGSTTTEVANAADSWLRQGYSTQQTNELIRSSMVLSKIGQIESAEATQYLTSALKGFDIEAEKSIEIVDKLAAIDLISATNASGLAEALSRTAASANLAGVEMVQLLGYVAVVGETTQKSMSQVGESFKTIFARFGNIKAGKFVDDETGEDLNDVAKVLSQFNIQLYDAQGNMADVGKILDKLASQWENLETVEKNALASAIAGTRQRENFIVLMDNYQTAIEYTNQALESSGTAMEKYDAYLQGIEASQAKLKATFEEFSQALIDSGIIKGFYDMGQGILQILTIIIQFKPLIPMFLLFLEFKTLQYGLQNWSKLNKHMKSFGQLFPALKKAFEIFVHSMKAGNSITESFSYTLDRMKASAYGAQMATTALSLALVAITAAIGVTITLYQKHQQQVEENISQAKEHIKTLQEEQETLADLKQQYIELSKSENYNDKTRESIKSIQEQINELVDDEAKGLDLVNGKLDEQMAKLDEISVKRSQENLKVIEGEVETLRQNLDQEFFSLGDRLNLVFYQGNLVVLQKAVRKFAGTAQDLNDKFPKAMAIVYENTFGNTKGTRLSLKEAQQALKEMKEVRDNIDPEQNNRAWNVANDIVKELTQRIDDYNKALNEYSKTQAQAVVGQYLFNHTISNKEELQAYIDTLKKGEYSEEALAAMTDILIAKFPEFASELGLVASEEDNVANSANAAAAKISELKKELESLNSIYETLNSAIEEYNSNGSISYDTWEKLIDLEDKYLSTLVDENGQIKSNNQALKDLIKTKIEDATLTRIETYVENLLVAAQNGTLKSTLDLTEKIEWNTNTRLANVMATIASNQALKANKEQILKTIGAMLQLSSSVSIGGDSTSKAAKETEKWEKVLEFTNKTLDDHIEKLEQEREAIEKNIEEQIKAKEKEIELLEAEKEALQDKNEEKNKEIELEELQRNLQKAQQRTMRVYYEDKGWVWEQDPEALQKAQQDLDDFYTEQEIDNIDKKIEALEKEVEALEKTTDEEEDSYDTRLKMLDEQIKKAEEYKNKWNEVKEDYEHQQNTIIATQILGANAEKDILNQRESVLNTFKTNYTAALAKVAEETEKSTNKVNTALSGINLETLNKMFAMQNIEGYTGASATLVALAKKTFKGESGAEFRYDTASKRYYLASSIQKTTINGKEVEVVSPNSPYYAKPYASGTKSARAGLANVDELGNELIVPKQGRYRMMEYGDTVVPHNLSQRLFEVASNPIQFIANALNSVKSPILSSNSLQNSSSIINIGTIELPSVTNGDNFIKQLQIIAANR